MLGLFKKSTTKEQSNAYILSSSGKKSSFFDYFKINGFVLFSFLITIILIFIMTTEIAKNKVIINQRNTELGLNYNKLIEINNTLGFLNGLKTQKFDGNNVVKMLEYLESINLYKYTLEFNNTKQFFFVKMKNVNQSELDNIIDKGLQSKVLNYFKTNKTIKIIEEDKVSVTLIFN